MNRNSGLEFENKKSELLNMPGLCVFLLCVFKVLVSVIPPVNSEENNYDYISSVITYTFVIITALFYAISSNYCKYARIMSISIFLSQGTTFDKKIHINMIFL